MAEHSSPDLTEAISKQGRNFHSNLNELEEQLSPAIGIKSMTLEPAIVRNLSEKLILRKDSVPDKHLHDQSKKSVDPATSLSSATYDEKLPYLSRRKSLVFQAYACRPVKRLSKARFPDEFPALETVKRKLSLSPPLCSRDFIVSEHSEYAAVLMRLPPVEYLHRCMPVSYYLKAFPSATEDHLNMFPYQHCAFSLCPVLQPSHYQCMRESTHFCELSTKPHPPSSSFKSYPITKTVRKTPHKLIPIHNLSIKGIPKVRS